MENTIENKQKFFAQYWGQESLNHPEYSIEPGNILTDRYLTNFFQIDDGYFLLLKPLELITHEDAIEVAKIIHDDKLDDAYIVRNDDSVTIHENSPLASIWFSDCEILHDENDQLPIQILYCYDFLRSKGYALPWMGLSVENQIEYGWVKLDK